MPGLAWGTMRTNRMGQIDMAQLFGPFVVFGHVGEPPECSQTARIGDAPAGFLEHFAVQRLEWMFSRVDTATGKLNLRVGLRLKRQQKIAGTV